MPFANGSEVRYAFVAESAYGTTPATPTFQVMRVTGGGGLKSNKTTVVSEEIRADRNVSAEILTGIDVTGSYNYELSYGSFDALFEGALKNTWATNVLKNGVATKFFTFEETLELGATDSFSRFSGCSIGSMSMALSSRAAVTGSFSIVGKQEALATTIVTGATYTVANTKTISTTGGSIASLTVGAISPAPKVRSLNFEVNNNARTRPVIGSLYSEEHGYGRCDVTGTLEAYFESNALYQAVLDHGGGALSFTVGNVTAEKYTFLFPSITFLNGERQLGGNNDDVIVSIPFRAVYDATEACSVKITRAVA